MLSPEAWQVYIVSESYDSSLLSVYKTKKMEDVDFTEDQLIEVAFQVLQAFAALNRRGGLHFKSLLHFENIVFDEQGFIKLQEMSHVFFD